MCKTYRENDNRSDDIDKYKKMPFEEMVKLMEEKEKDAKSKLK